MKQNISTIIRRPANLGGLSLCGGGVVLVTSGGGVTVNATADVVVTSTGSQVLLVEEIH